MELRQYRRYNLVCRVQYEWMTSDGCTGKGHGYTRDISTAGIFVITPELPVLQSKLKLEITLPRLREAIPGLRLQACGYIVRTEQDGFAAIADVGLQIGEARQELKRQEEHSLC